MTDLTSPNLSPEPRPPRRSPLKWALIILGVVIVLGVIGSQMAGDDVRETFSEISEGLDDGSEEASCPSLSADEVATLMEGWTGNGTLTVEATAKTETSGSDLFSEVWYLQGSAPGIDSQVFAFATDENGLLMGAEGVTREFFDWGAAATPDSPAAQEARAALDSAPECLG